MSAVDRLFAQYKSSYRAGGDADPRRFLAQVEGTDRAELAELIDAFLARAPAQPFDAGAFERFGASPRAQRLVAAVEARMAERLSDLRDAAQLARDELVGALAEDLGVGARRAKVADYYQRLEFGRLDASRVSERVWEALGRLLQVPAERVQAAAARAHPPEPTMARAAALAAPAAAPAEPADAPAYDEVDALFLGGPGSPLGPGG